MTVQRLEAMLKEQPFRAFDIHTSDGEVVRVRSPEFAWLHPSRRVILVATSKSEDREEIIDLLHITKLSRPDGGNGKSRRGRSAA
jgi:hypothetical protein